MKGAAGFADDDSAALGTPFSTFRIAIAVGIIIGHFFPDAGVALKPLGDGFISLIKMMIAPVIFCTVVHGIGSMRDLKKVGRVGVKTLFYFEAVSTLALVRSSKTSPSDAGAYAR